MAQIRQALSGHGYHTPVAVINSMLARSLAVSRTFPTRRIGIRGEPCLKCNPAKRCPSDLLSAVGSSDQFYTDKTRLSASGFTRICAGWRNDFLISNAHPEIWLKTRPATPASAHLFMKPSSTECPGLAFENLATLSPLYRLRRRNDRRYGVLKPSFWGWTASCSGVRRISHAHVVIDARPRRLTRTE
jgi:hypothetical protein